MRRKRISTLKVAYACNETLPFRHKRAEALSEGSYFFRMRALTCNLGRAQDETHRVCNHRLHVLRLNLSAARRLQRKQTPMFTTRFEVEFPRLFSAQAY